MAYRDYQRQRQMTLGDLLLENRIILLQGEIHDGNANELVMKLLVLAEREPPQGHPLLHQLARRQRQRHAGHLRHDADSAAARWPPTASAWRPAAARCCWPAAAKGKRFALPHAKVMIHQPYGQVGGQVSDIEIQADEILKTREVLNEILAKHTGQPIERIAKDTDRDFYMTAAEAKEYGVVDDILTQAAGRAPKTRTKTKSTSSRDQCIAVATAHALRQPPEQRATTHASDSLRHREERPRRAGDGHLQPPAEGPHRLSRLASQRRSGQLHRRPIAVPAVGRSQGRHPPVHQLAGRQRHGRAGDLRHHAVRHLRRGHLLHRPVRLDGRRAADRRRRAASATRCPTRGS